MRFWRIVVAMALLTSCEVAQTQEPATVRLVGTIKSFDGTTLIAITRQGEVRIQLPENAVVTGIVKRGLSDIKVGQFLGVGALPQPDGAQKAIRINIFPPGQAPNPGFRPWSATPQGTMTNGTVGASVADIDRQMLTLKYKDGEKKIIVTPQTEIVSSLPGDKSELKPGAAFSIVRAVKTSDGWFKADRINVGRDGVTPQ